jgi:hypothetical protein
MTFAIQFDSEIHRLRAVELLGHRLEPYDDENNIYLINDDDIKTIFENNRENYMFDLKKGKLPKFPRIYFSMPRI